MWTERYAVCVECSHGYLKHRRNQGARCPACVAKAQRLGLKKRYNGPELTDLDKRVARAPW